MEHLAENLGNFKEKNVLVVGDVMLDRWTFGQVTRISPEAPVPVIVKTGERVTLGGAANTANNIASLGARVHIAGVVGNDVNKATVFALLDEKGIGREAVLTHPTRPTIEKHRILSEDNRQVVRLDLEVREELNDEEEDALFNLILPRIESCDAIIFSDYANGVFSERFAQRLIRAAKKSKKPVFADFKPKHKKFFLGVDLISPNLKEGQEMTGLTEPEEIGRALVREFDANVALTRGGDGISVFKRRGGEHFHIPGEKIKMFDVSGAGDTAIAVLALGMASGLDIESAAILANEAGAIVVQKLGTATLSLEELSSALKAGNHVGNVNVVPKVWGYEKWLENNERYCCKILSVNKGFQCSLHYHKNKDETFVVTEGHIRLELGNEVLHLRPGAFIRIPPGTKHRFAGIENSLIMEMSSHHDDSDSYRLEESKKVSE